MELYIENVKYDGSFYLNNTLIDSYDNYAKIKNRELNNGKILESMVILYSPIDLELFLDDNIKKVKINFKNNKFLNGVGFFKNLTIFITSGEILESDK